MKIRDLKIASRLALSFGAVCCVIAMTGAAGSGHYLDAFAAIWLSATLVATPSLLKTRKTAPSSLMEQAK